MTTRSERVDYPKCPNCGHNLETDNSGNWCAFCDDSATIQEENKRLRQANAEMLAALQGIVPNFPLADHKDNQKWIRAQKAIKNATSQRSGSPP